MKANCRFPSCPWSGSVTALYNHCQMEHSKYVKEINDDNYCDLKFDQIHTDTFLLSGKEGLYWFIPDRRQNAHGISRGIFAIDDSEIQEYVILLGSNYNQFIASQGPFETLPLKSKRFDMSWTFRQLTTYHQIKANHVRLIFFDLKAPRFYKWENFEDFTYSDYGEQACITCVGRDQPIDHCCANGHSICRRCLPTMQQTVEVANLCPICPRQSFCGNSDGGSCYSDEED